MTKLIGLTGGIATGKSVVSDYLHQQGIPVIDADIVTHQVEQTGTPGLQALVDAFGQRILLADGALDRQALGRIVFNNPADLKQLVRIIDPFIREEILSQLKRYRDTEMTVLDAPTLFENGYVHLVDEVVVVYCDPVTQLQRLIKRNKLSIVSAIKRIGNQWPLQTKCDLADTIIYNSGTMTTTLTQVDRWLAKETK
ncbi:dephospho-CoA kinase [Lentilactobacillus buchneri]|mgnify:FL=1|uniref:Dephospho-CoA kinase n=1 Tax=Lentilactobacillus buchneri DSM 20057 TaxID=1423728 RepID=A0A4R5NUG2_LENBU|nr:dephospho-CoA kinase [Lentilactobacillus buchneri]WCJ51874.1 dephospho-CoA kinase [Lentilactobacillus sp. Egmn17]AEB73470.1 Dephospho-CoA kinase [Lentilactobacillus buchneri NRRL B-30929]KRK69054.1 dephospho-CoA kinase [Lentilactobacillus buchneri DSM 20057]MCT2882684.1 dephospho-CoA kinase [Lentilactobacillus buchneri]MCT2898694.1 dephospho-CoA kinase [Lentilactobacillus buchneri]